MADLLDEVVARALWDSPPKGAAERAADAVKAHIAAVLDAEEAKWEADQRRYGGFSSGVAAVCNLRRSLLGTTEEAP